MDVLLITAAVVLAVAAWGWRRWSLARRERLGLACPACGLDLAPYPGTYSCPRCYETIEHPYRRPADRGDSADDDGPDEDDEDLGGDAGRW